MSEPSANDSRMERLAPGIPLASKIALLAGVTIGLFLAIVASLTAPEYETLLLMAGLAGGGLAAAGIVIRQRRA